MILGNDHFNLFAKSSVSPADYNVALIWSAAEVTTGCAPFFRVAKDETLSMRDSCELIVVARD